MKLRPTHYRLFGLLSFLVLWEAVGQARMSSGLIPPFSATFITMIELLLDGTLVEHSAATLGRVYTGFVIAGTAGIASGLLIGWSRRAQNFFDFLIDFLRNVSSITLIPITILIVGIGFTQKIIVLAYAAYFPVVLNTINGVAETDRSMIDAVRSMGASDWEVMRTVVIYAALPSIVTGLRLAMGVAFVVVIAAELVGSTSGLGWFLHEASRTYDITAMFAAALLVSILGYLSSKVIVVTGDYLLAWREQAGGRTP